MRFVYTNHAADKLTEKESKNLGITKVKIKDIVENPKSLDTSTRPVLMAVGELDKNHSLCVVYRYIMSLKYYRDDDILVIRLSRKPYDYAEKEGDFIVHFSKEHKPVRIEVLNAKKFLAETRSILPQRQTPRVM